jgi:hypothetical protein
MLERMGGTVGQDSLALVFTDRICELADVHSLTFSLYDRQGRLVTTSAGPGSPDSTVALSLNQDVLASATLGEGRTEIPNVRGGTEVVWPLRTGTGEVLALGHVHYDPRLAEEADWKAFLLVGGVAGLFLVQFDCGPSEALELRHAIQPLATRPRQDADIPLAR